MQEIIDKVGIGNFPFFVGLGFMLGSAAFVFAIQLGLLAISGNSRFKVDYPHRIFGVISLLFFFAGGYFLIGYFLNLRIDLIIVKIVTPIVTSAITFYLGIISVRVLRR